MTTAADVELATRHTAVINGLIDTTEARAAALWAGVEHVSDPETVAAWVDAAGPLVEAASAAAQSATDGYFGLVTGDGPLGSDLAAPWAVRGVAAEPYLERPLATVRMALVDGVPWAEAKRAGLERALAMFATDVQLGQRHTADQWAKSGRVQGYRRVLNGLSCALCATASTQRYHRANLAPIHDRCDCGMAPITGDSDPGHVINSGLLRQLRDGSARSQYWSDRNLVVDESGHVVHVADDGSTSRFHPVVQPHGELGLELRAERSPRPAIPGR